MIQPGGYWWCGACKVMHPADQPCGLVVLVDDDVEAE